MTALLEYFIGCSIRVSQSGITIIMQGQIQEGSTFIKIIKLKNS